MHLLISVCRPLNFRGKARLLNTFGPAAGLCTCRIFGSTFQCDLRDFIQRQIYFGTFEPKETGLLRRYLRPGMTFVDVGANVGYFTALAAESVTPTGRVIALEPSQYAFERLSAMIAENALRHVKCIQTGLADSVGHTNLYLGVGSDNHTPTMIPHANTTCSQVPITTLDSITDQLGIDRIDLLKIDVEGYEPRVLLGARRLLCERRIGAVLCEFNEHWLARAGSSTEELESLVLEGGLVEGPSHGHERLLDNRFFRLASLP